jgi:hypothetical protein
LLVPRVAAQVVRELDEAVACVMGGRGEPGPSYIEIPTDVLRSHVPSTGVPEHAVVWLQFPDQIAITVTDEGPELSSELKAVIGDHLAQFFDDVADIAPELSNWTLKPGKVELTCLR